MTHGEKALLLIATVLIAWWLIDCAIWPWLPCPACQGAGVKRPAGRKVFRVCPHPQRRLRLGAYLVRPDLRGKR